jgi:hypothetical protein
MTTGSAGIRRRGNSTRGRTAATMDHAGIRGLVTAIHRSVAGLTRSSVGDHRCRCPHSPVEDFPDRARASRCAAIVNGCTACVLLKVQKLENSNVYNAR